MNDGIRPMDIRSVHTVDQVQINYKHTTIAISSGDFCPLTIHLLLGLKLRCQLVTSLLQGHLQLPLPGIEGGVRRVRVCGGGGGDAGGYIYLQERRQWGMRYSIRRLWHSHSTFTVTVTAQIG